MLRSLKLGKLFGIGVYVHWTFMLLPLWAVIMHYLGFLPNLGFYLLVVVAVFGCVVLHELGHALTARCYGIGTRDITLYPIGGVARLERMTEKPWEEIWIAVAGPAVNIVIAGMLFVGMAIAALISPGWLHEFVRDPLTPSIGSFFINLAAVNVVLVLFNMLPAFPMDGGRVFRATLSLWMNRLDATRIAATIGMFVVMGVGTLLFLETKSPLIIALSVFVIFAGQAELRYLQYRKQLEDEEIPEVLPVRRAPVHEEYPGYSHPHVPSSGLLFQPKIAVYIWDSQAGTWVKESYTPSQ